MIYISGYAGVGKTTLLNNVSSNLNIPKVSEYIRSNPELSQLDYYDYYVNIQNGDYFISDRSAVDIACWNSISSVVDDLSAKIKPHLVVVPTPPPVSTIVNNINNWRSDAIRRNAYLNKWGISWDINNDTYARMLHSRFLYDFEYYVSVYNELQWNLYISSPASSSYFSWQSNAQNKIEEIVHESRKV